MARERPSAETDPGVGTSSRLLDSAERLFAEHGIVATSLRQITSDAGANLAAVNYHFGSKDGLVRAVFSRRIAPLNDERLARLQAAEAAARGTPPIEAILEAFVVPALLTARSAERGGQGFLRLMGRALTEPAAEIRHLVFPQFEQVFRRFGEALVRSAPHLSLREAQQRLKFAIGAMAFTMSGPTLPAARGDSEADLPDEGTVTELVRFLAGGFRAKGKDR